MPSQTVRPSSSLNYPNYLKFLKFQTFRKNAMEITPDIMTSFMTLAQEHPEELAKVVAIVQAQGEPLDELLKAVNTIHEKMQA
jgi:hypothetical protein